MEVGRTEVSTGRSPTFLTAVTIVYSEQDIQACMQGDIQRGIHSGMDMMGGAPLGEGSGILSAGMQLQMDTQMDTEMDM